MIVLYAAALAILLGFFLIEKYLRRGSKDMGRTKYDRGSTKLVSAAMGATFVLLILSPALNWLGIGVIPALWAGVIGAVLGAGGLAIRYQAFHTLGRFFTRTLQETERHTLVTAGVYHRIRHPGYLSDILIFLGLGLAVRNWIAAGFVAAVYPAVYVYRIGAEEKMLAEIFKGEYEEYRRNTKKLIPFVY